ncbi:MAG TPA: response regulator [Ktedonobacterales bacterium]
MRKGSANGTAGSHGKAPVVLIAEDERPIAEALAMIVTDAGYLPVLASHGKRALELARERPPAMVITDLMMPHMDGLALMRALRQEAELAGHRPPVIVLTTAAPFPRAEWSLADAYLRKPFNIDEVEALLHRYLSLAAHSPYGSDRKPQAHAPEM